MEPCIRQPSSRRAGFKVPVTSNPFTPLKKQSTPLYQISRSYVEFGPFTAQEITGFHQRGVSRDSDYIRTLDHPDWMPLGYWMAEVLPKQLPIKPAVKSKSKDTAPRKRATAAVKTAKKTI